MFKDAISGSNLIVALYLIHFSFSLLAAELRNLRWSVVAITIQSFFLAIILAAFADIAGNPSLYLWSLTSLLTKVIIIPLLLWFNIRQLPTAESRPWLGTIPSVAVMLVLVVIFYSFFHTHVEFIAPSIQASIEPARSNLALSLTICALGLWVLLVRRDAAKAVIGLVLMENGVHLSLVTLAPTLPETTVIGIITNVIITVWFLLYLAGRIYQTLGTTDTAKLSELKR
jgi:hydrogenase-4 component E